MCMEGSLEWKCDFLLVLLCNSVGTVTLHLNDRLQL